jgi:endoglycosylceramidase
MSNPNRPIYLTNPTFEVDSGVAGNGPRAKPTTDETRHAPRKLPAIIRVDPQNGMFYDEHDRVRIFRGMAISYKVAPFMPTIDSFNPINSFAEDDLRLFDKLNLNVIRLGISWAACQPRRGPDGFDLEYLARLRQLVKKSEEYGLYVIIEYHQDLYAEKFTGDGAPSWAISKDWNTLPFPMPISGWKRAEYDDLLGPDGAPTNMNYTDSWGFHYVSDAVIRSFWGLYTNYDGIQDEFIGFWGKLAETFAGMDNVVGYGISITPDRVHAELMPRTVQRAIRRRPIHLSLAHLVAVSRPDRYKLSPTNV